MSILLSFLLCVTQAFGTELTEDDDETNCKQVIEMLNFQTTEQDKDFRFIKREIAVLKEAMEKPGITEIIGGIGYIFGLLGISYYWHARNLLQARKK